MSIVSSDLRKKIFTDLVVVKKNTWHQIKCIGNSPGVRYAITKPDVEHIYED